MSEWPVLYVFMLIAYVCGSIPFGKIIGRLKGVDIQKLGSGNIGFANSVRVLGWKPGVFVLVGDVAKGFLPVYLSIYHMPYWQSLMVGLVAILAHVFPVWLRFKGGKGIATGLGISLVLAPKIALLGLCIYVVTFVLFKKSAIASLAATWSMSLTALVLEPKFVYFALLLGFIATYTHRSNIRQILSTHYAD